MPQAGFKTTIPASERPQTHALDCAATGIGVVPVYYVKIHQVSWLSLPVRGCHSTVPFRCYITKTINRAYPDTQLHNLHVCLSNWSLRYWQSIAKKREFIAVLSHNARCKLAHESFMRDVLALCCYWLAWVFRWMLRQRPVDRKCQSSPQTRRV
jgi:hypothetical protein